MRLKLQKLIVLKKLRHALNCPACETIIVLDDEVFEEKPDVVQCYKCRKDWLVLQLDNNKDGSLEIEIMYRDTKEKNG